MTFDFQRYLEQVYPGEKFQIEELNGGLVNWVVRARRQTKESTPWEDSFNDSIVLKQAPPYVAKRVPETPFSQSRQVIEAHALKCLYDRREELRESDGWPDLFPAFINFDPESHVLTVRDLGRGEDLLTYLRKLRDEVNNDEDGRIDKMRETWSSIGSRIGCFFAKMHSSKVLKSSTFPSNDGSQSAIHLLYTTVVQPARSRMALFLPNDEVSTLYQRVEEDFLREDESQELTFTHGDCDINNLLLVNLELPRIIDWEFASIGRGPHGDMAHLLAHLHGRLIFLRSGGDTLAAEAASEILHSIKSAYREASTQLRGLWTHIGVKDVQKQRLAAKIARSAFIVHGRDLVNNANERHWECRCCYISSGIPEGCVARKAIVMAGAFYLRAARESVEAFAQAEHLEAVALEDPVLLPLFTDYSTRQVT